MKIGIALGSGSSRGWSHIGVLKELASLGVEPDIVCGTSIGALVGAAYAGDKLEALGEWAASLTRLETARFFNISSAFNGFVDMDKFQTFLGQCVADKDATIEDFDKQYAAVATDLESGREIWLSKGPVLEAVRASISLPGLFPAVRNDHKWLVDGGLVNPVPVSVCRALGAELVIAVNLNNDIVGKHFTKPSKPPEVSQEAVGTVDRLAGAVKDYAASVFSFNNKEEQAPSLFEAFAGSVNITQDRITRSRMAGDPPDILVAPALSQIGLLEFYRAEEAMEEGRKCVQRMASEIRRVLQLD